MEIEAFSQGKSEEPSRERRIGKILNNSYVVDINGKSYSIPISQELVVRVGQSLPDDVPVEALREINDRILVIYISNPSTETDVDTGEMIVIPRRYYGKWFDMSILDVPEMRKRALLVPRSLIRYVKRGELVEAVRIIDTDSSLPDSYQLVLPVDQDVPEDPSRIGSDIIPLSLFSEKDRYELNGLLRGMDILAISNKYPGRDEQGRGYINNLLNKASSSVLPYNEDLGNIKRSLEEAILFTDDNSRGYYILYDIPRKSYSRLISSSPSVTIKIRPVDEVPSDEYYRSLQSASYFNKLATDPLFITRKIGFYYNNWKMYAYEPIPDIEGISDEIYGGGAVTAGADREMFDILSTYKKRLYIGDLSKESPPEVSGELKKNLDEVRNKAIEMESAVRDFKYTPPPINLEVPWLFSLKNVIGWIEPARGVFQDVSVGDIMKKIFFSDNPPIINLERSTITSDVISDYLMGKRLRIPDDRPGKSYAFSLRLDISLRQGTRMDNILQNLKDFVLGVGDYKFGREDDRRDADLIIIPKFKESLRKFLNYLLDRKDVNITEQGDMNFGLDGPSFSRSPIFATITKENTIKIIVDAVDDQEFFRIANEHYTAIKNWNNKYVASVEEGGYLLSVPVQSGIINEQVLEDLNTPDIYIIPGPLSTFIVNDIPQRRCCIGMLDGDIDVYGTATFFELILGVIVWTNTISNNDFAISSAIRIVYKRITGRIYLLGGSSEKEIEEENDYQEAKYMPIWLVDKDNFAAYMKQVIVEELMKRFGK